MIPNMGIYQFLRKHGCFHNKTVPRTHTIMSGGTLYVAEDVYDEFLGVYAREIEDGNRSLTFSELRSSGVFRMYFDIDVLDEKVLDEDYFAEIAKSILETVRKFYLDVDRDVLKCVVCLTTPKEVSVSGNNYVKNGCHLIFPFLRVTLDEALQLRSAVVVDLEKRFGKRTCTVNPWCDVIDKAPYYNGLKMCGSVKTVTCQECHGNKKNVRKKPDVLAILKDIRAVRKKTYPRHHDPGFDYSNVMSIEKDEFKNQDLAELFSAYQEATGYLMCPACGDKGWHLENRFYMPTKILDGDGALAEADLEYLADNKHEMMRWTSIRCRPFDKITEGYVVPRGYTPPRSERPTQSLQLAGTHLEKLSPGIYREAVNAELLGTDAAGIRTWKGSEITDTKIIKMIAHEIHAYSNVYKDLEIRQVFQMNVAKTMTTSIVSSPTAYANSLTSQPQKRRKGATRALENMAVANGVCAQTPKVVQITARVFVRVSGNGSNHCLNKGTEHTSNSIYFWVSPEGIAHKCFSRKDVLGRSGKNCKNFRSELKPISPPLVQALFIPDSKKEGGVKKRNGSRKSAWDVMC